MAREQKKVARGAGAGLGVASGRDRRVAAWPGVAGGCRGDQDRATLVTLPYVKKGGSCRCRGKGVPLLAAAAKHQAAPARRARFANVAFAIKSITTFKYFG